MRSYEFYIKPAPGEYTQAAVPLPPPSGAVISGLVTDADGPVEGALVLLLEQESEKLVCYTVTDSLGRFWFGPLDEGPLYFLRAQKPGGNVRLVELGA